MPFKFGQLNELDPNNWSIGAKDLFYSLAIINFLMIYEIKSRESFKISINQTKRFFFDENEILLV